MTTAGLDTATIIESTPLFSNQWYLQNTGQTGGTVGADLNVVDAWNVATGSGVTIGVVHQGADYEHPDLNDNYSAALSYDFAQDDSDPFPREEEEIRSVFAGTFGYPTATGTHIAGIIAAEGGNDTGIIGVAPDATFASLRIRFGLDPLEGGELQALTYQNQEIDIYNSSASFSSFETIPPEFFSGLETNITEGRGGLGNIHVATTTAGGLEDNINYHPFNNSRYTVTVGAIDHNGQHPGYSAPGAALLISGYSHNEEANITTTESRVIAGLSQTIRNNYLEDYQGFTGAATAQVSGVIALMLEANPNLNWRDVQHILVETAEQNDPNDVDWVQNGAGYDVNYKYGFGAVDATAAVNTALTWQSVGEEVALTSESVTINSIIPDNSTTGVSSSFTITEDIDLESIEVIFDSDHSYRGDLSIVLTSPDGTESVLAESRVDDGDNYDSWLFTSVRHWGESSQGEWTLSVVDETQTNEGIWNSWQLNLYGTEAQASSGSPVVNPDQGNSNNGSSANSNNSLYRFQNETVAGTYLYVGEAEAENIRDNFPNFAEEGLAFPVSLEPEDGLVPIYRFQSEVSPGTYIFVGESERADINSNFADSFMEEGLAFYVLGADSSEGEPIYRFQNDSQPGTYLFASGLEAENIRDNFDDFTEEGIAFRV